MESSFLIARQLEITTGRAGARVEPGRRAARGRHGLFVLLSLAAASAVAAPFAYVSNAGENTVSVIDVASQSAVTKINVGTNPTAAAVTPDGSRVYVTNRQMADYEGSVSVIDTATNTVIATIALGGAPYGVAVTPDGSHVYVAKHHAQQIAVISTATNEVVQLISVGIKPFQLAITPDGSTVYATCQDVCNTMVAVSTASQTVTGSFTIPSGAQAGLDVTPDGTKLYVSSSASPLVSVLSATTGALLTTIPMETTNGGVVASPAGDKVYVATTAGNVAVISTYTDSVAATIPAGSFGGLRGIALTSDGAVAYVADWFNHRVAVIDTATNSLVNTIPVGTNPYSMGKFIQKERYEFTGFFAPVDNAPTLNTMKAGAAVPVKFALGGDKGLNVLAPGSPSSRQVVCADSSATSAIEETVAAGGSALQYDVVAAQYIYAWKTDKSWSGTCREFNLKLKDGSSRKAIFQFSR